MSAPDHIMTLEAHLQQRQAMGGRLMAAAGCFDVFSARLARQAGFEALMVGGNGLALSRYGQPLVQLLSPEAITEALYIVREEGDAPLIADAADGFGNALHVAATVRAFEFAGASMVQFSDRPLRRRDHPEGPRFAVAEMIGKLKAAVDARRHCLIGAVVEVVPEDTVTSLWDRAAAYVEVGADVLVVRSETRPLSLLQPGLEIQELAPIGFEWPLELAHHTGVDLSGKGYGFSLHPYVMRRFFEKARADLQRLRDDMEPKTTPLNKKNAV